MATLQNSVAISPVAQRSETKAQKDAHKLAFRATKPFPLDAMVTFGTTTNPWRGRGYVFFEAVIRPRLATGATVSELILAGQQVINPCTNQPFSKALCVDFLRWLYTWGGGHMLVNGNQWSPPAA
jgi:hypothetical protein